MGRLVKALIAVAAFLLVLFVAPMLIGEKGYVLIALGKYTIEFTVVSLAFLLLMSVLALYIVLRLLCAGSTSLVRVGRWFAGSKKTKKQLAFYDGLFALALGDQSQAQKKMTQTQGGDFQGFNYLALGQIAMQKGDAKEAQTWFEKAKTSDNPQSARTATLLVAQQHLFDNAPKQALQELDKLTGPDDAQTVKLRARALAASNEWQQIESSLSGWKKLLQDDYSYYSQHSATHKFAEIASKQGANQLKDHWQQLPRKQRNDEDFRNAFIEQLIHQGMHQDAQNYIVEWYAKKPLPQSTLQLIKSLRLQQPAPLIKLLESAIKMHPEDPQYYAALGHLAYHAGDLALSEKALAKAITQDETEQELCLLADLYERTHAYERAIQVMRKVHARQC